jgi:hypothetical protein
MLDPKIQEALDKIKTVDLSKLQTVRISPSSYSSDVTNNMGYNGLSTDDIPTLTTASISALTTSNITGLSSIQLSAIGGTQGYTLGASGGANVNWQSPYYVNSAIGTPMTVGKSGQLDLKGEDADITINGKSMSAWMAQVEQRLNILTPNPELEKEWDDLRRLGERYRRLEKKCKEKAETWNKLKAMPPPTVD